MNTKDLDYFLTVCQEKSISRAAKLLYLSPQGLSKIMKNMENELGVQLLSRTAKGITLTEAGERYPEVTLTYREFPDKQVERLFLNDREGNVAFSIGPFDTSLYDITPIASFEIKLLVNKSHPLAFEESVSINALRNQPLYIESNQFSIYHIIMNACSEKGFEPDVKFETSGFSLCHKLVSQNKGISVTVDFISDDLAQKDLVLIPFNDLDARWEPCMLIRKSEEVSDDILAFQKHIKKWI